VCLCIYHLPQAPSLTALFTSGVRITEKGFWERVESIVSKTLVCMWPHMWGPYARLFHPDYSVTLAFLSSDTFYDD
jgi:hypothetical protein